MGRIRNSVRIRRAYEKMLITVSLDEKSTGVGMSQEYDGASHSPDHGVTPLVLAPVVSAAASDVTLPPDWTVGNTVGTSGNANLAWRVNGSAISSVWTEGTDYEFGDGGKELWIMRNFTTSDKVSIVCKVLILDQRTGIVVPYTSDAVTLTAVSAQESAPTLHLSQNNIIYDDMSDDLTEWEYRAARNLPQLMTQAEATNDACYRKSVAISFCKGSAGVLTSGFGLVVKDSSNTVVATIGASDTSATITDSIRINSLTRTSLEVDCRTIRKERFTITAADAGGNQIPSAKDTVEVVRSHRTFDSPEIVNTSDYTPRDSRYYNAVRVSVNGEELEYPEVYLAIDYYTKANQTGATERYVGSGNGCMFNPNESGDGITAADNGFDMTVSCDYHDLLVPALDDATVGNLTDERGIILLI